MKKNKIRLAAIFSTAAVLALGASMVSYAKGWSQLDDGRWVYLDNYGDRVYEEWKRDAAGTNYYWLDDNGIMATDRIVDDGSEIYYVDGSGGRVYNAWYSTPNWNGDDVNGQWVDSLWYFFGESGRAYRSDSGLTKKTIGDAVYFFDEEGRMASGWVDYAGETYYCGGEREGWARTGWQMLEPRENVRDDYEDQEWFYFSTSGKMKKNTTSYIDNAYYTFDGNGVMEDDWHDNDGKDSYASSDGTLKTGWIYTSEFDSDEPHWYYLVTVRENGKVTRSVPFNSVNRDGRRRAKSIDGKTYLFNSDGTLVDGLVYLDYSTPDDSADGASCKVLESGLYYFEEAEAGNGQMQTGKFTYNYEGDVSYYCFASSGKAYTATLKDGVVYGDDGRRIQAEDGNSYTLAELDYDIRDTSGNVKIKAGTQFAVSSAGRVKTSGSIRIDDVYYDINSSTYEAVYDADRNDR